MVSKRFIEEFNLEAIKKLLNGIIQLQKYQQDLVSLRMVFTALVKKYNQPVPVRIAAEHRILC